MLGHIGPPAKRLCWRADDSPLFLVLESSLLKKPHEKTLKNVVIAGPLCQNILDPRMAEY